MTPAAWERWLAAEPRLTALARRLYPADPHEAVGRTLDVYVRHHARVRDPALPWLLTVCRHQCSALHTANRRLAYDVDVDRPAPPLDLDARLDAAAAVPALTRLAPRQRAILAATAIGLRPRHIARETGLPVERVYRQLIRARARARRLLAESAVTVSP